MHNFVILAPVGCANAGHGTDQIMGSYARKEEIMFTQLNPPLPVHVIDKGDGYAVAVIDYGQEHNLIWVTAITESGELWCAPNPKVRVQTNWTMGRNVTLHAV